MSDDPATSPVRAFRHPPSRRGGWTIAVIFAVGLAVLAGLFLSPRAAAPPVPPGLAPGMATDRPVTGVVVDGRPLGPDPAAVAAAVRAAARGVGPTLDLVCLVDVEADLVPAVAAALDLRAAVHPTLFQRAQPGPAGRPRVGVCVLSRHPLYAGGPAWAAAPPRPVGVRAVAGIDGRAVSVACVVTDESGGEAAAMPTGCDVVVGRVAGAWFASARRGARAEISTGPASPSSMAFRATAPAAAPVTETVESGTAERGR